MGMRFLDLHVHSSFSSGMDPKEDLERHADILGTDIRFCDGKVAEDGIEIAFKTKSELKRKLLNAPYLILEPLSKESLQTATRIKHAIIRTTLTPTLARSMHNNSCAIEISLSSLIHSSGIRRIRVIKGIKTNLKYARKYGVALVVTTGSGSIYDLRSSYQVFELLKVLGFTDAEAKDAMYTTPLEIVSFGREKMERRLVREGVKIL